MPNGRRAKKGATRRYAAFRLNPLSQIAFASNRLQPLPPASTHESLAHHKQQTGAERRGSGQSPVILFGNAYLHSQGQLGDGFLY